VKIVWDEPKRQINLEKHGLDFADLAGFDWQAALFQPARPSRSGRRRFKVLGSLGDRLVSVIISPLGSEAISIVSLRPADPDERAHYGR
jgi:uncharacterized DUF497 family protein